MVMGTLLERLEGYYKTALKAREQHKVETLRMIKAAVQRMAIDKRKDTLDDQETIQILSQQAKQRRETMDAAKQGNRQDVLVQATAELEMINAYLPKQLSIDEVKRLIEEAIASAGPSQGPIMKYVMGKAAGTADGKLVSQLVNERLKQS